MRAIFPPYPPIPFFATTRWQGMSSNMRLAPQADPTALGRPRIADHGGQFTVGTHLTIGNALHTAPHPLLKGRAVGLQGQVELPPLSRQIFTDLGRPRSRSMHCGFQGEKRYRQPADRSLAGWSAPPALAAQRKTFRQNRPSSRVLKKKQALTANASAYIVTCPKLV